MTELERELLDALRRLADAAESYATSEPDMPTHESTEADFDSTLDAARAAIARAEGR